MNKLNIKKGQVFGILVILNEEDFIIGNNLIKIRQFNCKCNCGNTKIIRLGDLRSGKTKSCGCLLKKIVGKIGKRNKTHSMYNTRIYGIWKNIKQRCNNKKNTKYKDYGGRGIIYDPKWENFLGFYEDMKEGYKENLTIDREDNNGNYNKNNCRWITQKKQNSNTRRCIMHKGKCISEWADILKVNPNLLYGRLRMGWSIEKTLTFKIK